MNIVIVGCSRVGAYIATSLDTQGHNVCVVDPEPRAFRRLRSDFRGRSVVGTGIDEDVLLEAGIDSADIFVAATNGDNTNLMSAQVARRIFQVPRVIARVYDPVRADIFEKVGIETISPTVIIGDMLLRKIESSTATNPTGSD